MSASHKDCAARRYSIDAGNAPATVVQFSFVREGRTQPRDLPALYIFHDFLTVA
jgi:hypothetical protein